MPACLRHVKQTGVSCQSPSVRLSDALVKLLEQAEYGADRKVRCGLFFLLAKPCAERSVRTLLGKGGPGPAARRTSRLHRFTAGPNLDRARPSNAGSGWVPAEATQRRAHLSDRQAVSPTGSVDQRTASARVASDRRANVELLCCQASRVAQECR